MAKTIKIRVYSSLCVEAATLLGKQIKLGRKERKWTELELAGRANISRVTLQKIEKGDLSCAIGLVFETAALVGVALFSNEQTSIAMQYGRVEDRIALLPKRVRKNKQLVNDDF